jgi:hypothetical protein
MRVLNDLFVVERERRQIVDREPRCFFCVCAGVKRVRMWHQRVVRDRDDASSRIALWVSERVELFEVDVLYAGFFSQLADSGCIERLVFKHEASRQGISTGERLRETLDDKKLESAISNREKNNVHGDAQLGHRVTITYLVSMEHLFILEAQELLNRNGAMLDTDGIFGRATAFALREFQAERNLSDVTMAALRRLPEPSRYIPCRVVTFICREEVRSREFYEAKACRPVRPGFSSGVTIGVGYDLGYQFNFEKDWSGVLTPAQIAALRLWVGKSGPAVDVAIPQLANVVIPWRASWTVFIKKTLPETIKQTRTAFMRPKKMSALSFGALVSLVYNRGVSMEDPKNDPGRRQEMRDIRDALAAGDLASVPAALRSMKRLWPGTAIAERREGEAKIFEEGL